MQLRQLEERALKDRPGDKRTYGMSHINKRNQQVREGEGCAGAGYRCNRMWSLKGRPGDKRTHGIVITVVEFPVALSARYRPLLQIQAEVEPFVSCLGCI